MFLGVCFSKQLRDTTRRDSRNAHRASLPKELIRVENFNGRAEITARGKGRGSIQRQARTSVAAKSSPLNSTHGFSLVALDIKSVASRAAAGRGGEAEAKLRCAER